jgi:hypothetical protein
MAKKMQHLTLLSYLDPERNGHHPLPVIIDATPGGLIGLAVPLLPLRCPRLESVLPGLLSLNGSLLRLGVGCVGVRSAAASWRARSFAGGSGKRA